MLKVTAVMGVSAVLAVAATVVRTKIVAVELGPPGVGTLAILTAFLTFATPVLGLGVGQSGVREVAAANSAGDDQQRDELRRTLYLASLVLAGAGSLVVLITARPIASWVLGEAGLADETRWVALGVFASIATGAASADLTGFRRIRLLAKLQPLAAAGATTAVLGAYVGGVDLLPVALVAPPVALAIGTYLYARSLPRPAARVDRRQFVHHFRRLAGLGAAFVLVMGLTALGMLLLRLLIASKLDLASTGEFQAAFAMAGYYVSFLFAAIGSDYLPLLSGLAHEPDRMNQAANTQALVAVLLSVPLVTVLIAAAPIVVPVFYTDAFDASVDLLRIMLLGEIARVAGWAVGYILVARDSRTLFVISEVLFNGVTLGAAAVLIPALGLRGAAIAYLVAQIAFLLWTLLFARWTSDFRLSGANAKVLGGSAAALGILYAAVRHGGSAWIIAVLIIAGCSAVSVRQIWKLGGLRVGALSGRRA